MLERIISSRMMDISGFFRVFIMLLWFDFCIVIIRIMKKEIKNMLVMVVRCCF